MSYYILPKYANSETINIKLELSNDDVVNSLVNSLVNPSLIYYLNNILLQLNNPDFLLKFIKINNIISQYKYIYSKTSIYNIPFILLSPIIISLGTYFDVVLICSIIG